VGYTEFLVGQNAATPSNLPKAITALEDASTIFADRWAKGNFQHAGDVSNNAMTLLNFITNELLRVEVARKGAGSYVGTPFSIEMARLHGLGVTNATINDHLATVQAGAGNGILPTHLGTPLSLKFNKLLNKVKHRNPNLMNFRFEGGKHIFVVCADHTSGGAEGVYEFDVAEFCSHCRTVTANI
jgi:hypothetical protein